MTLHICLLILGVACLVAATALVLYPRWPAAVPAYAGMVFLHLSYYIDVPMRTFLFWGIAAAMVAGLHFISPKGEIDGNRASNLYVGLSAMAGSLLGMLVHVNVMVLGVILGAFIGQMAYRRTPNGRWLGESPKTFLRYYCAKCLPVVVAVAIIAISVEGFILDNYQNGLLQ